MKHTHHKLHSAIRRELPTFSFSLRWNSLDSTSNAPTFKISTWEMKVKVTQSCPTLCDPMDCSLLGSSIHGILQTRILEWVAVPFSRGSSHSRDRTQVPLIAGRFLPSEPPEKPKNTGVGNQWICPTQESNQGLLHCRQVDSLTAELIAYTPI